MSNSEFPLPPNWLGLYCGNESLQELESWFAAARDFGFREVQPAMCWSPLKPDDFNALNVLLDRYKLQARCIGVYNDLYKWDGPLQWRNTCNDLCTAIEHAPDCGADRVVCWSGSASIDLMAEDERNSHPAALDRLQAHASRILPLLEQQEVRLLIEPWRTHVLPDEVATASFCSRFGGRVQAVLDPPNFIRPDQWPDRDQRVQTITSELLEHTGMIHLKDMTVDDEGTLGLPQFGRGNIATGRFLQAVQPLLWKVPVIAEHVASPDDIPAAIEAVNKAVGQPHRLSRFGTRDN